MSAPDPNPAPLHEAIDEDRALAAYLELIERDMAAHPERIRPLSPKLLERARSLVGHLHPDLDEDLVDVDL